jgi:hypothetical protein
LGYVDTQLNKDLQLKLPMATPEQAAQRICRNLGRDFKRRYLPSWWSLIMRIYQMVPWFIFKRMGKAA